MAKKKKKSAGLLGGGIGGIVVIVLLIVIVYTQFMMTPKASSVGDVYENADYSVTVDGAVSSLISGIASSLLGTAKINHTVIGSKEVDKDEYVSFSVYIFDDADDAKEYYKDIKDEMDKDSDNVVIRRGKAVYYGDKQGSFKFRTAM